MSDISDPSAMKAIVVADNPQRTMRWGEVPRATPGSGEVLIEVAATAVNRADLLQRIGRYPPPPGVTDIMGLEASGTIVATGGEVGPWVVGQRVCCLLAGGGYGQWVTCPVGQLLPVPDDMPLLEAAALPEALFTAFVNICLEAELAPKERVLVHAGASGVGTAALQMCRSLGNPVYVTTSAAKLDLVRELGAELAIDRNGEDFVTRVAQHTDKYGVDVVLDPVGGSYLDGNLRVLAKGGRLVVIGLLGGAEAVLPLGLLLRRRLKVIGSVLRGRSVAEKAQIRDALQQRVWPFVLSGQIRPVIDSVLPIQEVAAAHELLKANRTCGKVVLQVSS